MKMKSFEICLAVVSVICYLKFRNKPTMNRRIFFSFNARYNSTHCVTDLQKRKLIVQLDPKAIFRNY